MSSASLGPLEAVERVKSLGRRAAKAEALRDHLLVERGRMEGEIATLGQDIEKLLKVEELFRSLMDHLVVNQVRTLESVVTDGLQTIFHDQDLRLESDIEPKYNKVSIDFHLRQGKANDPLSIRGKPLESFGGGATSVVALILRVLTLLKLKRLPFLVLDETLLAVSDEYIAPTAKFLNALASSMDLHFLLITHKTAYCDYSDVAYQGREEVGDGERMLRIKKVSSGAHLEVRP